MVRRLEMDKTQGIEQLFASGMAKRKIARTLGIDRKSVDRHLAALTLKGASAQEALAGEAPTGSESANQQSETTRKDRLESVQSRSECARYRDQIIAKLEQGLTAQRIYQDLVADHGFSAKYHFVRRYVHNLVGSKELPVRRIEVEAGQEMQTMARVLGAWITLANFARPTCFVWY